MSLDTIPAVCCDLQALLLSLVRGVNRDNLPFS